MTEFTVGNRVQAHAFAERAGIFSQTEYWSDFRKVFRTVPVIGTRDGETVLSCMIHRLPIYGTLYSVGYLTRGFVCDFHDAELIREFVEWLKAYGKKKHYIYFIFDPCWDERVDFSETSSGLTELLTELGCKKITKGTLQPATDYRLSLPREGTAEEKKSAVFASFDSKLKNVLHTAQNRGTECHRFRGDDREAMDIFFDLFVQTTVQKGFGHRSRSYYRKFGKALKDYVTVYLWKYDYEKDMRYTDGEIRKQTARLDELNERLTASEGNEAKRQRLLPQIHETEDQIAAWKKRKETANRYRDNPWLTAAFCLTVGTHTHHLYGANSPALRDLKLTADYWEMIEDSIEKGCTDFHMGGTLKLNTERLQDDPLYELYLYKKRYNGQFVEFPGEFHLILDEKKYTFFHTKLNYFKRIIFRF